MAEYPVAVSSQLAPILRALRRRRKLTQARLAASLGVTRQAIVKMEARPEGMSVDRLMRVLNALGSRMVIRDADEGGEW